MYGLVWWTVYALTKVLFWCLFPVLQSNKGNKYQNRTPVSAKPLVMIVQWGVLSNLVYKAPVTQKSTSKSRTKSYENLVDVVESGNSWSILAWPCFVWGMAVGGCSTDEALPKHCLSTAWARRNPFVSDKPLNTHYFPWYQRVTPVRWPCSAHDRPLNFCVLPRLPKF